MWASCHLQKEQPPQDLSWITEMSFHQIAIDVIKKVNEIAPPPVPPPPPLQKDFSHQSDFEDSLKIWQKETEVLRKKWKERREAELESRKGKQHVVFFPGYVSNSERSHQLLLRNLSWFEADYHLQEILAEEFSEHEPDYTVKTNLEFGRDTVVLNVDDLPEPSLKAELHRHKIIPMGFLQLHHARLSDDRQRFFIHGYYIDRSIPLGFGYIFQLKNGAWEKEVSSIYPIH
ncbi:MAG: hypothetical protein EA411_01120 [Saprospirales bacterium]|nr:MAG: hypothetical protein EA411_01120 [Saprospirales bacterium]